MMSSFPKNPMKPSLNQFHRATSLTAILALSGPAHAASDTWAADADGEWGNAASWAGNQVPGSIGTGNAGTSTTDDAIFDGAGNYTVYTAGNRGIDVTTFSNTGTTNILGGTTAAAGGASLYIFGNLTVSTGAGAVTIGDTASSARQVVIRTGTLNYTNNSSNLLTLANAIQTRGSSGTTTITFTGSGNTLASGPVAGGGGASIALSKTGSGVLTLSGANGYGGGTAITAGTLTFLNTGAKSTAGSGNHVFSAGTTLGLGVATAGSFYTAADVASAFALTGVGTGNLARINITATTNVGIDTTAGDFELSSSIGGAPSKGLAKLGTNTLTLSGTNTYTGATIVRAGTLKVTSTGIINDGAISGGTGTIIGGSTLDIDGGSVNFIGGTALAVGDNTTAGNVMVRAGSNFNLTGNISIGQGSSGVANTPVSNFTQTGGTTTFGASSILYVGNYRGATMDIQGGTLTSSSAANIGIRGNSSLTISGANTAVTFTQINLGLPAGSLLPTADLNLNGGTLTLGANGIIKTVTDGAKTVSFNGGTLKASAASTDFVNADSVFVKSGGATIDTNAFDVTIDNALLQFEATTGSLTKTGAGKLSLSGINTYTGSTTITEGTLALDITGSITTSSAVNIAAGAKLETLLQSTYAIPSGKTVTFDVNAAGAGSSGQIHADGLDISAATVAFNISGTLDDAAYVIATYTSKTGAAFASVTPPAGYQIDYAFNGGTQIALVPAPASGYTTWASANAGAQAANLDFDDDGVDNGVEFFLGQTGSSFTSSPTSFNGDTATWTNGGNIPASQYGTQFVVQSSTDLVSWTPILIDNPNLNNQAGSVSFTLTGTGKQFVRLSVTPN